MNLCIEGLTPLVHFLRTAVVPRMLEKNVPDETPIKAPIPTTCPRPHVETGAP